MSISGVSPFSPMPANDARAEFQRLREAHSRGPSGYERDEKKEAGPRPSVGAEAMAGDVGDVHRAAGLSKVNIKV
jgi:hypothetical protein